MPATTCHRHVAWAPPADRQASHAAPRSHCMLDAFQGPNEPGTRVARRVRRILVVVIAPSHRSDLSMQIGLSAGALASVQVSLWLFFKIPERRGVGEPVPRPGLLGG